MRMSDWSSDVCSSDLAGRGKKLVPSPVEARATALGVAVRSPVSLKTADEQAALAALDADAAVVAAYGLILPRAVLDTPRHGCLNVHRSEEHTSELQSLMRISYAVFCLKKKT